MVKPVDEHSRIDLAGGTEGGIHLLFFYRASSFLARQATTRSTASPDFMQGSVEGFMAKLNTVRDAFFAMEII
ncbi:hypothetical protein TRIATDRAFT_258114 [Trichoderma atroviride IMI 206040]|uniref:Uncharacterized protein n=1 Tax=Hypocrea atroviridis (strain ATCC 20476 / IMI 206040) TaxID=452589 RepID=G9P2F4_HYPAI|nr:uncharacterized protein TRIATDRAFT_258114 [Trichoderma atroviride IMI 206040]EHK42691.1 hypothetical protein TRIATDRAFT_258114 [Trichoderma atroviride IMI 206040]